MGGGQRDYRLTLPCGDRGALHRGAQVLSVERHQTPG